MKNIKIILIICVIIIGAADIITYHFYSDLNLFSQQDEVNLYSFEDNQKVFTANLQNASKHEGIWQKSMNEDVIKKINRNLRSSSSLKKNLPEIKVSLTKSKNANENILKYLNNAKEHATSDVEKQYVDLLIQKASIDKKIYDSNAKMIVEYEKFANRNLSSGRLNVKMREATLDLIENNATDQDILAINNKILNLLKNNPDFKKKLEDMKLNPSFLGN
jgi:hypothetical protein